jgi:hypothetical protein
MNINVEDQEGKKLYEIVPCNDCQTMLLKSPKSGEFSYHYDNDLKMWICLDQPHYLESLLVREFMFYSTGFLPL